MAKQKQIHCRVCGKLFTPCAYCVSHADTFRWRNFACSIECAKKYIKEALDYRESQKHTATPGKETTVEVLDILELSAVKTKAKKKQTTEKTETESK